jgi:hypothetical protein
MAKAVDKSITWILLSEATARVVSAYQSREFAERQLTNWLSAGELRWRSACLEGSRRNSDPGSGDPEFWRGIQVPLLQPPAPPWICLAPATWSIIKWDQSCAWRDGYTFYRIEVAEADLTKLLPVDGINEDDAGTTKAFVIAEIKRMKAAGEIPSICTKGKGKTELAKLIVERVKIAVRRGVLTKPVDYRHIVNNLELWGLWPISSIK